MNKHFFDAVRPLFRGRMTQNQVDGMNIIVAYASHNGVSRRMLAYILATIFHETAHWMQPIREGAIRSGPKYTDAQSRRAVGALKAKGIIRTNYALPEANGHSYYGRGLVQITWPDNYKKFGIYDNPDKALEWDHALDITFRGMIDGMFTGVSLSDFITDANVDYVNARKVVNGDTLKNGKDIASDAFVFYNALADYTHEPLPKEVTDEPRSTTGAWPPKWWPFSAN